MQRDIQALKRKIEIAGKEFAESIERATEKGTMYIVNALCGSGKSYQTVKHILSKNNPYNLIVVPTVNLSLEYKELFLKYGGNAILLSCINSSEGKSAVKSIEETVKECNRIHEQKVVLIITQEAFDRLPVFYNPEKWVVFHDEIPDITNSHSMTIPYHLNLLTNHLEVDPTHDNKFEGLIKLKPKNRLHTCDVLERDEDEIDNIIYPVISRCLSPYKDVYTDEKQWNKLVVDGDITKTGKRCKGDTRNTLFFNIITRPEFYSRFKKIIFIGARTENSVFQEIYTKNYNIFFEDYFEISAKLRNPLEHLKNVYIDILYIQEHRMTKSSNLENLENLKCKNTRISEALKRSFQYLYNLGEPFLYACNNDVNIPFYSTLKNATKISIKSNGLNSYQDFNNIVCLAPVNRPPKELWALKKYGITEEFLNMERNLECAYQTISRTSIRDPKNLSAKTIIVSDRQIAEDLRDILDCKKCNISQLEGCQDFNKPDIKTASPDYRKYLYAKRKTEDFIKYVGEKHIEKFFNDYPEYASREFIKLKSMLNTNCYNNILFEYSNSEDVQKISLENRKTSKLLIARFKTLANVDEIKNIFEEEKIAMFGYNDFEYGYNSLTDNKTSGLLFIPLSKFVNDLEYKQCIEYLGYLFKKYNLLDVVIEDVASLEAPCKNNVDVDACFFISNLTERATYAEKYALDMKKVIETVERCSVKNSLVTMFEESETVEEVEVEGEIKEYSCADFFRDDDIFPVMSDKECDINTVQATKTPNSYATLSETTKSQFRRQMNAIALLHKEQKHSNKMINPVPNPDYNDVYEQGLNMLDSLAGEPCSCDTIEVSVAI